MCLSIPSASLSYVSFVIHIVVNVIRREHRMWKTPVACAKPVVCKTGHILPTFVYETCVDFK